MVTGPLKPQVDKVWNVFWSGGIDNSARRPRPYSDLRWSKFNNFALAEMYEVIDQNVFPFIRGRGEAGSTCATIIRRSGRMPRAATASTASPSPGSTRTHP
jgi:hypothetical protein